MNELTPEQKIDEILIPILFGEDGMLKPDGSSLISRILYAQKSKLAKSRKQLLSLLNEEKIKSIEATRNSSPAEIDARLQALKQPKEN